MAARRFGIGILGAGMAAKPHALALKALADGVEVRGVFRRDPEKLGTFCTAHDFPAAASLEALLADPLLDALLVLTPPNAHEEAVAAAARAGKHVLLEKPVARSSDEAERVVALAEAAGIRLGIVFQHRFRAASMALRALMQDGGLGTLHAVSVTMPWWRPQSYYDQPGRGTLAQDGGGVLITQGIHSIDLMLSICGPVESVSAMAATTGLHRMETEDFVGAGMRFANGAAGALMATTAQYPGGAESLTLICEKATATLSSGTAVLQFHDGRTETIGENAGGSGGGADPMAFPFAWHQAQIAEFVAAVQAGRDPASSGRTALQAHYLIDALVESSREGRRVEVRR